jgi:hypothetical protein
LTFGIYSASFTEWITAGYAAQAMTVVNALVLVHSIFTQLEPILRSVMRVLFTCCCVARSATATDDADEAKNAVEHQQQRRRKYNHRQKKEKKEEEEGNPKCRRQWHFGPNLPEHLHSTAQVSHRDQVQKGRNRRKRVKKRREKTSHR